MTTPDDQIIDPWSFLDYKEKFRKPPRSGMAPTWVGDHARRLDAYRVYDSYYRNAARNWLNSSVDQETRDDRREYGDPYMIVESVLSSVLGDEQEIRVEGYVEENAPPPPGSQPSQDLDEEAEIQEGPATQQKNRLDTWMQQERFLLKLIENERTGVRLGDMCYILGWDEKKQRPRLRVYDPGFYFPVLDDWDNEEDWPRRIHIAWEYEREVGGKEKKFLRRKTWELREVAPYSLPWNTERSTESCFMWEYEWEMDDVKNEIDDLSDSNATVITEETDLEIDFIPVIHIPNTVSENEHYGVSSIAQVMQIFDDLTATDTDLQAAAATTGTPMVSVKGKVTKDEEGRVNVVGPGSVWESEQGAELLSTATALDPMLKNKDSLQDRLSVNARVPNTLIGRIDPSKVPSGIVLTLSFQPHSNMIRQMRLVRQDKYDLLLKFVSRFYAKAGMLSVVLPAHLDFGSYLPADKQEITSIIQQLLSVHGLSTETAVELMVQAGFPIDNVQREVERIRSQNYEAAIQATEATADINVGRALLGLPAVAILPPEEEEEEGGEALPGNNPLLNPDQIPPPFP